MAPTAQQLAADLERLYALGQADLPQLAYIYARLNRDLAGTTAEVAGAFATGYAGKGMGGASGQAYQAWAALRDRLQDALATTALHVEAAGQAIVTIADVYVANDTEAAAALHAIMANGLPAADRVDALPTTPGSVTFSNGVQQP
jgi:hypothetical protein